MVAKIILFLLPALVCAKIQVKIDVSDDQRYAKAEAFGQQVDRISDTERNTFGLNDGDLKDAVHKFDGRRPDKAYPCPEDWCQLLTTLRPISARVLGVRTNPVILANKHFENHSRYPAKYGGQISQEVETTIATATNTGGTITVGQEVTYNVNFFVGSFGGRTSASFNNNWGESTTKTQTTTLNSGLSIDVDLQPGQACKAVLSANQGTMEVAVEYEASLSGNVLYNCEGRGYRTDVNFLLKAAGRPKTIKSTEIIKIGFYTEENVFVYNVNMTRNAQNAAVGF